MENKEKSFTKDENTMWNAVHNKLLKWHPKANLQHDRFWFITFTKPYDFKHKENEDVWFMQIKVWDRTENKFIGNIKSREIYRVVMNCHIDTTHQRIVLTTKEYISFYSFTGEILKAYCFTTERTPKREGDCMFINANTFITISSVGFSIIDIDRNIESSYWTMKKIKIDDRLYLKNLRDDKYTVVIAAYHEQDMTPFQSNVWERQDIQIEPLLPRTPYKTLTFTPLHQITYHRVAGFDLSGYILNPNKVTVTLENNYLRINNTLLCIDDFAEIKT